MACAASLESDPEKVGLELCSESDSDNDKECSICHELFTHPKLLPCAHVMCRHCILTWLSANQEPVCPLCRCAIADTEQGKQPADGWEKVVEELPDDVAMAALVECTRLLRGEHVCGGCRQSSAVSVCLHCGDMLCDTCTTAHGNLSATRLHKVESLSTMTAEKLCVSQPASCSEHADRASELYCPKHGTAICHLCASSVHRACPEVILFDKRVQDLKEELTGMSEMLKTAEQNLTRAIDDLDDKLLEAEQKTNKALAEIEEACNRLENAVKACRKRLKELSLTFKQNVEVAVHDTQSGMKQRRGQVTSHRRLVDRVKMTSPPGQLEKVTELMRSRVGDIEVDVTNSSTVVSMSLVQLHPDCIAVDSIVTEISNLGWFTFAVLSGMPVQDKIVAEAESKAAEAKETLGQWKFAPHNYVCFSNDDLTVERTKGQRAILVSTVPMEFDVLYEIRIDKIEGNSGRFMSCGVVKAPPSQLGQLPETTCHGWEHGIVFCDILIKYNEKNHINLNTRLLNIKEGDRVGFSRDRDGCIHLFIGGKQEYVLFDPDQRPSHVFFELYGKYKKVTCLPPTKVYGKV